METLQNDAPIAIDAHSRGMNLRPFALVLALSAITASQTIASNAGACGTPLPEDTIASHYEALNAHDRARVLAQWNENATVVSLGEPPLIEPIDRAATRWVQTKAPVTFHVDKIDETERTATAHVTVVFEGRRIEDTLLLTSAPSGRWRIAGKTSRLLPAKEKTVAPAIRY